MAAPFGDFIAGPSDSKVTAVHAALHHDGKVIIFHCRSYPFWTRLYDPVENEISETNLVVPIWPVATETRPIEPSRIFCAGHCFLPDGRLLVAGGERDSLILINIFLQIYNKIGVLTTVLYMIQQITHLGQYHLTKVMSPTKWSTEDGILH